MCIAVLMRVKDSGVRGWKVAVLSVWGRVKVENIQKWTLRWATIPSYFISTLTNASSKDFRLQSFNIFFLDNAFTNHKWLKWLSLNIVLCFLRRVPSWQSTIETITWNCCGCSIDWVRLYRHGSERSCRAPAGAERTSPVSPVSHLKKNSGHSLQRNQEERLFIESPLQRSVENCSSSDDMDCDYGRWFVRTANTVWAFLCFQGAHVGSFWDEEVKALGNVVPRRLPLPLQPEHTTGLDKHEFNGDRSVSDTI